MEPPGLLMSCAANRSALKLLLVTAGMPLPVGNVPRRDLPAQDPLWSCCSLSFLVALWPRALATPPCQLSRLLTWSSRPHSTEGEENLPVNMIFTSAVSP